MPLVGFEPVIPASKQSQTHALARAATVMFNLKMYVALLIHFAKLRQNSDTLACVVNCSFTDFPYHQ
jgi:hypothetical protein